MEQTSMFEKRPEKSGGANFSSCGKYRYSLFRIWDMERALVSFIMLNPSKADARCDDATTVQCVRRAAANGCGRYEAVNLFAAISTNPKDLRLMVDPVGEMNDYHIRQAFADAKLIVVAWGTDGAYLDRGAAVLTMLNNHELWCLGRNVDGSPRFPRAIKRLQPLECFV